MSREIRITPSILNADFQNLDYEIGRIAAQSDLIHLDVMDNIFVPNFTFDFQRASEIIHSCPIPVDAHLMVADVDHIAPALQKQGVQASQFTRKPQVILVRPCDQLEKLEQERG